MNVVVGGKIFITHHTTSSPTRHQFLPDALNLGEPGSHEIALLRMKIQGKYKSPPVKIRFSIRDILRSVMTTDCFMDLDLVKDAYEMAQHMNTCLTTTTGTLSFQDVAEAIALDENTLRVYKKPYMHNGWEVHLDVYLYPGYTRNNVIMYTPDGHVRKRTLTLEPLISRKRKEEISTRDAADLIAEGYDGAEERKFHVLTNTKNCVEFDMSNVFRHRRLDSVHVFSEELVLPSQLDNLNRHGRIASLFVKPKEDTMNLLEPTVLVPEKPHYVSMKGGVIYNAEFDVTVDKDTTRFRPQEVSLVFHIRRRWLRGDEPMEQSKE